MHSVRIKIVEQLKLSVETHCSVTTSMILSVALLGVDAGGGCVHGKNLTVPLL